MSADPRVVWLRHALAERPPLIAPTERSERRQVGWRLPVWVVDELNAIARAAGMATTDVVSVMLYSYLRQREERRW